MTGRLSLYFSVYSGSSSEKAMAIHSRTLAWEIPWTEEPGRLQSIDHKELDMTEHIPARAVKITIFLKVT